MEKRDKNGLTETQFLERYNPGKYERPSVTADMAVFTVMPGERRKTSPDRELFLLLIRRAGHPFLDFWALPGGFVGAGETAEAAARRELEEETGLACAYLEQLHTFSEPGRDPRARIISCAHLALADPLYTSVRSGDDAGDARWFRLGSRLLERKAECGASGLSVTERFELELYGGGAGFISIVGCSSRYGLHGVQREYFIEEAGELAFDHAQIIWQALALLRRRTEYAAAAFYFLPERFTLAQLQSVYEAVTGVTACPEALRRNMAPFLLETADLGAEGHRRIPLYERNWKGIAGYGNGLL